MKLTRYRYTGPQSAASLRVGAKEELLDVQLLPGLPVDLPADHEYTQILLELKHLVLEPVEADTTKPSAIAPGAEKKGAKANVS
ncbi:hypothetical protein [Pseudomonas rubra]|uniref:Uncharacterized protein n=1 Tax=Pseudomonas rubra TaxID=2942627 RepID=A0ABT5PF68_9PSED|nr:hypothetical protein [Pseudomonas rubra]MDD1016837.1 hypothetical protein [Pseudomonas rubra]MDD1041476.1 hypothetical protein [Pseudomonas rubra]MDD1154981.1 hypothetical protein [Pseudomonas rubra]